MNADKKPEPDVQELKGHVEETAGRVFGDRDLVAHGMADQITAQARKAAAQAGSAARSVGQLVREKAMRKLGELHQRLHEAAEDAADAADAEQERKSSGAETTGDLPDRHA